VTLTYAINGFDLHDPDNGRKLLDAPVWAGSLTMRNLAIALPQVHGNLPVWQAPLDSSGISFRIRLLDNDPDELNTKWNQIVRRLGVGNNQPVILSRTRSTTADTDGRQTTTEAQLTAVDPPDFSCAGGFVTATLGFNIPSGRWYGDVATEALALADTDQPSTIAAASTMPITNAAFLAHGPIAGLHVYDNVSQTGFGWAGANVTSAQWLLVDLASFTAWIKDSEDYELSGTNVSAGLANSGVGWLSLVPGVTDELSTSSISVSSSGTSGDSNLTLRAAPAYH
jgi:hypothetical protein